MNTSDFTSRLEFIFNHFGLNASSFADKVNVQRSSISHLLSGRNNPSLDFIIKVIDTFPEIDMVWLTTGKGNFSKIENPTSITESNNFEENLFSQINQTEIPSAPNLEIEIKKESIFENEKNIFQNIENFEELEKVILFYKDGTFKLYQNKR